MTRDWQTVPELADLRQDLARFEQHILQLAGRLGLRLAALHVDHLAVRCHDERTATRWRQGWAQCGQLLSDKIINQRPIQVFALDRPLALGPWSVPLIELPWPGQRHYPHEGWEHLEVVLPGDPHTLRDRALSLLDAEALSDPALRVKLSQPAAAGERLPNPTLAVSDGVATIKFHPWSLQRVIESETR